MRGSSYSWDSCLFRARLNSVIPSHQSMKSTAFNTTLVPAPSLLLFLYQSSFTLYFIPLFPTMLGKDAKHRLDSLQSVLWLVLVSQSLPCLERVFPSEPQHPTSSSLHIVNTQRWGGGGVTLLTTLGDLQRASQSRQGQAQCRWITVWNQGRGREGSACSHAKAHVAPFELQITVEHSSGSRALSLPFWIPSLLLTPGLLLALLVITGDY